MEDALDNDGDVIMAIDSDARPMPSPTPTLMPTPTPARPYVQNDGCPVPITENNAMDLPVAELAFTTRAALANHPLKSPTRYRAAVPLPASYTAKVMPDQIPSMTSAV